MLYLVYFHLSEEISAITINFINSWTVQQLPAHITGTLFGGGFRGIQITPFWTPAPERDFGFFFSISQPPQRQLHHTQGNLNCTEQTALRKTVQAVGCDYSFIDSSRGSRVTSGEQRKPAARCTDPSNGCETTYFDAFAGLVELSLRLASVTEILVNTQHGSCSG